MRGCDLVGVRKLQEQPTDTVTRYADYWMIGMLDAICRSMIRFRRLSTWKNFAACLAPEDRGWQLAESHVRKSGRGAPGIRGKIFPPVGRQNDDLAIEVNVKMA